MIQEELNYTLNHFKKFPTQLVISSFNKPYGCVLFNTNTNRVFFVDPDNNYITSFPIQNIISVVHGIPNSPLSHKIQVPHFYTLELTFLDEYNQKQEMLLSMFADQKPHNFNKIYYLIMALISENNLYHQLVTKNDEYPLTFDEFYDIYLLFYHQIKIPCYSIFVVSGLGNVSNKAINVILFDEKKQIAFAYKKQYFSTLNYHQIKHITYASYGTPLAGKYNQRNLHILVVTYTSSTGEEKEILFTRMIFEILGYGKHFNNLRDELFKRFPNSNANVQTNPNGTIEL